MFLGNFLLYQLTDLLTDFLLHVNFTEWQTFMFILLLTNIEARQTKKNTFYKTENLYA